MPTLANRIANFMTPSAIASTFGIGGGYEGAIDRGRRRPVSSRISSEDHQANERQRRILAQNSADLARNFSVAAWAIRKHLDYVTSFRFKADTPDEGFNRDLEAWMAAKQKRQAFDVAMRHPYRRALRILEACTVRDGDCLWLKLTGERNRGQIQAIQSDRIHLPAGDIPAGDDPERWNLGVKTDGQNRAVAYAISDREGKTGYKFRRIVASRSVLHHGYFDFYDQTRGLSPINAALNQFRDVYEGFEYSLAKVKVAQLFGLMFRRDAEENPFGDGAAVPTQDADGDGEADSRYEVDLTSGIFSLDLNPGDSAEVLESKTPATETVEFLKLIIAVALKALDIPFSFFDESFTNFYGSRGGLIQYLKSCAHKLAGLQEFQDEWAAWRMGLAVADGELSLPSGRDFDFLKWEFVPAGVPWWDPSKEVKGAAMSVAAGFSSPQRICRETGTDFRQNIAETAEALRYAEENGVKLAYADSSVFAPFKGEAAESTEATEPAGLAAGDRSEGGENA